MEETPFNIIPRRVVAGLDIEFKNIRELVQGGPEVGDLYINGTFVSSPENFSAPLLILNGYIYLPAYKRGFWKSGFRLAKVDVNTKTVKYFNKVYPLICKLSVDDIGLSFCIDAEGSKSITIKKDDL